MQITDKDIQTFRERAKTELQSNGAVGRLAWDSVVDALCNEVEELRKNAAPGNAAAMRAALSDLVYNIEIRAQAFGIFSIVDKKTWLDAQAALSAPARNCDRPECQTEDGARKTWWKEEIHPRCDGQTMDHDEVPYTDWLFAPAKGGAE